MWDVVLYDDHNAWSPSRAGEETLMWDVVLYDDHNAWSPSLNRMGRRGQGVGGFEVQMVQIGTWLAAKGYAVLAITPGQGDMHWEEGVQYRDASELKQTQTRCLITARSSRIPQWVDADCTLTSMVDDPTHEPAKYAHLRQRTLAVCLSDWQAGIFNRLGFSTAVVPSMIDDWIYLLRDPMLPQWVPKKSGYVCVNAWNKGTDATLALWQEMRLPGKLSVGTPYGAPQDAWQRCSRAGAEWLGVLTPRQVVDALARAEAVFRVCERPETFGVTDAIAEVVGTRVHALFTKGFGASSDVLWSPFLTDSRESFESGLRMHEGMGMVPVSSHGDYRVSKVMPQWLALTGLEAR